MNNREEFLQQMGLRIKKLRMIHGLTQGELAQKCGYTSASSNSSINKVESGKSDLPVTKLIKMAEVLGVTAAFILGEEDPAEEERYFASHNTMRLLNKRLSRSEQEELLKGLQIYFSVENPVTQDTSDVTAMPRESVQA